MTLRTWMGELLIVAGVVLIVAGQTGGPVELIGAFAVVLSFAHGQVSDRLAEAERERRACVRMPGIDDHTVDCYRWAGRYFVGKEILWCAYFVAHGSWSALAGVGLFLAYPLWRRWWRARYPLP